MPLIIVCLDAFTFACYNHGKHPIHVVPQPDLTTFHANKNARIAGGVLDAPAQPSVKGKKGLGDRMSLALADLSERDRQDCGGFCRFFLSRNALGTWHYDGFFFGR